METETTANTPTEPWKWAGSVREEGSEKLFHGIVSVPADSTKPVEVWLSDGSCSFARTSDELEPKRSLAFMPGANKRQALQKALTRYPKLTRVEEGELRIAIPWGVEYQADIDLDIECFKLAKKDGTDTFLSTLFTRIEERRHELKKLQTKAESISLENDNLRRAKDRFDKYMNERPMRLRVAAEVLNRHKRKCRLAKREQQGPEKDISKD